MVDLDVFQWCGILKLYEKGNIHEYVQSHGLEPLIEELFVCDEPVLFVALGI